MQRLKGIIRKVAAITAGVAMIGATMTSAVALDLKDYPSPYVKAGTFDTSTAIVVGANAAATDTLGAVDIASGLQYEAKTCTASGTVSVSGGQTKKIPLGKDLAYSNGFDFDLDHGDITSLEDSTITFQSTSYDYGEHIVVGGGSANLTLQTSLSSSDDDYKSDTRLELATNAFKYVYGFDKTINVSKTTSTNALEVKFLGKKLKITKQETDTSFTAYVGDQYYMKIGDTITANNKKLKLLNVGSNGAIQVDVEGTQDTISNGVTKTINSVEITNDNQFYTDTLAERAATIYAGKDSAETYASGDAYIGEDKDDPGWKWVISGLSSAGANTTNIKRSALMGTYLAVQNAKAKDDYSDNPVKAGECYSLPNNYASVCLDSMTVADTDYATYEIYKDSGVDLSTYNAEFSAATSATTIHIHAGTTEGLKLLNSGFNTTFLNGTTGFGDASDKKTTDIYLYRNGSGGTLVFYKAVTVSGNPIRFVGQIGHTAAANDGPGAGKLVMTKLAQVIYGDTKDSNLEIYLAMNSTDNQEFITINSTSDQTADLTANTDMLQLQLAKTNSTYNGFGVTASSEEAGELRWGELTGGALLTNGTIGTKDEDHRTLYGIVIKTPKTAGSGDNYKFSVPKDQVKANVVVKGTSATTSSGQTCTVSKITIDTKTSSEITAASNFNLILVGGPCANPLADSVAGEKCSAWSLKSGEALIKLVANGDKVAMLVAGTDASDTRRAAKILRDYKDYATTLAGDKVTVKSETLSKVSLG